MYHTIRHQERRLSLIGTESLRTDTESLERMVVDFVRHTTPTTSPEALSALGERVQLGDMSPVLIEYEKMIRHPLQNALFGSLVRILLIQVQKTKVDLDVAMSSLDKLLKSNELNFAFLAILPSLVISYSAVTYVWGVWRRRRFNLDNTGVKETIRRSCWKMERLLTTCKDHVPHMEQGLLLLEMCIVRDYVTRVPSSQHVKDMVADLAWVEDDQQPVSVRLAALFRIERHFL
jgi:nuclear-control-of-ATPase protein 2